MTECTFCSIVARQAPVTMIREWEDVIAIRPLDPVTPGHVLVIPHQHVADAGADPAVAGRVMVAAAELVGEMPAANIITSRGAAATQTQFHLHLHVVPRQRGDGLPLPWTPQQAAARRNLHVVKDHGRTQAPS
jgi:histidine triad (HIT) family protein